MDLVSAAEETICILEQADQDFHIGIVGTGPGFGSIIELMARPELEDFFPRMNLLACAGAGFPRKLAVKAEALGARIYDDYSQMLQAHPEINLLIELSGRPELLRGLRREVPPNISILDHTSAVFLCALLIMSEVSNKCKMDLSGQQTLLYTVMDEMPDDVLFLDVEGRIMDANRHVCERLDKNKEELLGKPCWEIAPGANRHGCIAGEPTCPFQVTLREGRDAETLQTWVDAQGRVRYYQVRTYPIFNSRGQVHQVIEVRRDVTLRTEMEKRLQQAEKLAAIGELSTYIAHEIRNPLFAIGGFANALLRAPDLASESREKVRIILDESKRLDNILKSIINFARPTKADTSEVDVNEVILDTIHLFSIGSKERGVTVDARLAEDVPRVRGDAELIKQCLINLIKNALEAMPDGGVLTVSSSMGTHDVHVMVRDTGLGIPKEAQHMIFNPFYTTKKKEGSGLGLAMTKKIIGDLGGSLHLESQVGTGTTVSINLPPFIPVEPEL